MNKKLILPIFAFFIVILIVFLYRRNKSVVAKTLAKFNVEAMTFDNSPGVEEGKKMTSSEMLKNTIMSLKPLKDEIILSNVPDTEVELFTDCDFQGLSAKFKAGDYNLQDLINKGIGNDAVSSIKVPEGYTAILYHNDNFSGNSVTVTSDIPCLKNNDEVSSMKVIKGKIKKTVREGLFFIKIDDKFVIGKNNGNKLSDHRTSPYFEYSGGSGNVYCGDGRFTDLIESKHGRFINKFAMRCSDGSVKGPYGNGGGDNGPFYIQSPNGFTKVKVLGGAKIDTIDVYTNNENKGRIGTGEGNDLGWKTCDDSDRIIGFNVNTDGNQLTPPFGVVCGKDKVPSLEDARNTFATSNSAISNYPDTNPVPFLFSFVSSADKDQIYEFDLYDVRGKVYGLDQYKKMGRITVEIKDGNMYMKQDSKYFRYNNSSIQTTDNINEASVCTMEAVLDPEKLAPKYLQASYNYLNTSGVDRSTLSTFCGTNIRFSDGTLKIYPSSMGKDDKGLLSDPIARAFESICACHMNKDFYKDLLCSDKLIKENFGIDPENPKNKSLLDAIRDDMKCMKPNCTFEKCRNVITNEKNYIKMNQQSTSDNITEGCGSGVICITNQNINIGEGAVLQDTTINAESVSQCGGERISKPQMLDVGDFIWLDDSKTILGKEQQCFITQDGTSRIVDSKTAGCSDITTKTYIEFNNPEKIRETIDPTTGLKTISLKGITINESSLDVNTIKEFIHEKLKDMLNLPGITNIQVSYNKPALVITYFDEIPEKSNNKFTSEPTTDQTTPKKSNNNMIYIIILVLLILGAGGFFIMKKK